MGPHCTQLYQSSDGLQIREWLDRALAMPSWMSMFPSLKLYHLSSSASNHCLILLHLTLKVKRKKQKRLFLFESMWLKDHIYERVVKEACKEGLAIVTGSPFQRCMEVCRQRLHTWNREKFDHVGKKIASI